MSAAACHPIWQASCRSAAFHPIMLRAMDSLRRRRGWRHEACEEVALEIYNNLPLSAKSYILSPAFKGGPIIKLQGMGAPTEEERKINAMWTKAVLHHNPKTTPGNYYHADVMLEDLGSSKQSLYGLRITGMFIYCKDVLHTDYKFLRIQPKFRRAQRLKIVAHTIITLYACSKIHQAYRPKHTYRAHF